MSIGGFGPIGGPGAIGAPAPTGEATTLTPALVTNAQSFYAPTVARGVRTLTPALWTDTDTFYAPTVASRNTISPALWTDTDTFYAPSVLRIVRTLTPALWSDPDTIYAPSIEGEAAVLTPALYTNAQVFYAPIVYPIESLQPDADISDGGWTNELDSNVNLYASIDEAAANDADYIKSSSEPIADVVTLSLSNPVQALAQPVYVKYRYKKLANIAGTMELKARLMEGASEIAEWVHSDISEDFVEASQELTVPQFNAISDASNLRVEFEATFAP